MINLDCHMINVLNALFLLAVEICLYSPQVCREEENAPSPFVARAVRIWVERRIHTVPSVFPASIRIHGAWSKPLKLRLQHVNLRENGIFPPLSIHDLRFYRPYTAVGALNHATPSVPSEPLEVTHQ